MKGGLKNFGGHLFILLEATRPEGGRPRLRGLEKVGSPSSEKRRRDDTSLFNVKLSFKILENTGLVWLECKDFD